MSPFVRRGDIISIFILVSSYVKNRVLCWSPSCPFMGFGSTQTLQLCKVLSNDNGFNPICSFWDNALIPFSIGFYVKTKSSGGGQLVWPTTKVSFWYQLVKQIFRKRSSKYYPTRHCMHSGSHVWLSFPHKVTTLGNDLVRDLSAKFGFNPFCTSWEDWRMQNVRTMDSKW